MPTDAARGRVVQRWLLGAALAALLAVMVVGVATLAWPSAMARGEIAIAPASDFAPGTVTSYAATEHGLRLLSQAGAYGARPSDHPSDGRQVVHVVRLPDGDLRVFVGADHHFGWTVVWYPLDDLRVIGDYRGLFRDPRRGSAWTVDGVHVFGPAQRGLDMFDFRVRGDGVLVVDLSELREGVARSRVLPPPYDVTAEGWATSGWPSR